MGDVDPAPPTEAAVRCSAGDERHRRSVRAWVDDVRWRRVLLVAVGCVAVHVRRSTTRKSEATTWHAARRHSAERLREVADGVRDDVDRCDLHFVQCSTPCSRREEHLHAGCDRDYPHLHRCVVRDRRRKVHDGWCQYLGLYICRTKDTEACRPKNACRMVGNISRSFLGMPRIEMLDYQRLSSDAVCIL